MLKKKLFAVGLTSAMVLSLVACGETSDNGNGSSSSSSSSSSSASSSNESGSGDENKTDANAMGAAIEDHSSIDAASIATFEDGNAPFASVNDSDWSGDDGTEVSVTSVLDSNVLLMTRPNNGNNSVAIDIVGLLGENAANCKSVSIDVGAISPDGNFVACSGDVVVFAGAGKAECKASWSVYKANQAEKTVVVDLGDNELVAGNYLTFANFTDTAANTSMFVDNIICYDASGNALPLNTTVEFAVDGVGAYDWSNMVKQPVDEKLLFTGVESGGGWWPADGNNWSFKNDSTYQYFNAEEIGFVPGSVITIYYTVEDIEDVDAYMRYPYFRAQDWGQDEEGNKIETGSGFCGGIVDISYARGTSGVVANKYDLADDSFVLHYLDDFEENAGYDEADDTPAENMYINDSYTICQYTFDYINETFIQAGCAEDWWNYVDMFGIADRGTVLKINAVTIGKVAE